MPILQNTAQLSLEDMCNAALPPPLEPLYSIARDRLDENRNGDVDFVAHALNVFKGVKSSKRAFYKNIWC